jgi:ABC-type uncharacterized transport system involved in gliding motility auxiliary subunit
LNRYRINKEILNNCSELSNQVPLLLLGCTALTYEECSQLDAFINQGNNVMFAVSPFFVNYNNDWNITPQYNKNFFTFLSQYGFNIGNSIIYDTQCVNISFATSNSSSPSQINIQYPFWINSVPEKLYNYHVNFFWCAPLTCDNNYTIILQSSENSFLVSEDNYMKYSSPFNIDKIIPNNSTRDSYNIVVKKQINNNSKIIVSSDYLFCSKMIDFTSNLNNLEFLVNCILDLNNCSDLISIRNKKKAL